MSKIQPVTCIFYGTGAYVKQNIIKPKTPTLMEILQTNNYQKIKEKENNIQIYSINKRIVLFRKRKKELLYLIIIIDNQKKK